MTERRVPDVAELAEDLARIESAIERGAKETRTAIDALGKRMEDRYVTKEMHVGDRRLSDQRGEEHGRLLAEMKERHTWVARTAFTALVLPILVLIVGALLLTGGAR